MEWKCTEFPLIKRPVKKVMLTIFWDMKGPITIDFLEKDATVNIANYLGQKFAIHYSEIKGKGLNEGKLMIFLYFSLVNISLILQ